jgi:hypothetical protein
MNLLRNAHTGETVAVELISQETRNGTTIYRIRYQGIIQTVTGYQGWYIVK